MPVFPADDFHIERAAQHLRDGELVAFPTETVYGLGAFALDENAVSKIYAAKGRPSTNPLIVHISGIAEAQALVSEWNERAQILAQAFWPGPLTLVLPKSDLIPGIVSAGLETVALRAPASPTARKLLERVQIPLAAPSANASGRISPTTAAHVVASLGEEIWVLDGGECEIGIESTVVDVSGSFTSILRPGVISETEITALVGPIVSPKIPREDASQPSPGMSERHYAPRARVHLFPTLTDAHFHAVLLGKGQKIGVLCFHSIRLEGAREIVLPLDPRACAQQLYAALHALDEADVGLILIEEAPNGPQWTGVRDRLNRAAKA